MFLRPVIKSEGKILVLTGVVGIWIGTLTTVFWDADYDGSRSGLVLGMAAITLAGVAFWYGTRRWWRRSKSV